MLERVNADIRPWDAMEAVQELHNRGYYPRTSKKGIAADVLIGEGAEGVGRWPKILRMCIEGGATLALSSLGAALFYLQRSLVGEY